MSDYAPAVSRTPFCRAWHQALAGTSVPARIIAGGSVAIVALVALSSAGVGTVGPLSTPVLLPILAVLVDIGDRAASSEGSEAVLIVILPALDLAAFGLALMATLVRRWRLDLTGAAPSMLGLFVFGLGWIGWLSAGSVGTLPLEGPWVAHHALGWLLLPTASRRSVTKTERGLAGDGSPLDWRRRCRRSRSSSWLP